jgi:hypothetical protein
VLFSKEAVEPLVEAIDGVASRTAIVLTCCEHRTTSVLHFYDSLRARGFCVDEVPPEQQHPIYRHESIHLYRATRGGTHSTGASQPQPLFASQ